MLQRHLLVLPVVPMAIDRSRMRRPQRQHRLAHSRSHHPHTTRSRVSPSHSTCQRCHLGSPRIGGTLLAEDIPKRRPRLQVHPLINISIRIRIIISINNHIRILSYFNHNVPHTRMPQSSLAPRASVTHSGENHLLLHGAIFVC